MIMHEGWCKSSYIVGDSHTSRTINRLTGGLTGSLEENEGAMTSTKANNVVQLATRILAYANYGDKGEQNARWWNPGLRRLGQAFCQAHDPKCSTCIATRVCRARAQIEVSIMP